MKNLLLNILLLPLRNRVAKLLSIFLLILVSMSIALPANASDMYNSTIVNNKVCVIPDAYARLVVEQVTTELTNRVSNNPYFTEHMIKAHLDSPKHAANVAKEVQHRLNLFCESLS